MYKLSATVSRKIMSINGIDYTDEMVIVEKQWKQRNIRNTKRKRNDRIEAHYSQLQCNIYK